MQTSCGGVGLLPRLFPGGLSHGSRSQVQETLLSRSANHPQGSWRDQSPCPKGRSKWMLTDFYGRILVPPTEVEHTQACFASMIERLRTALEQAGIRDQIVVIERTGRYHRPVQRAFAKAGFEVRIIHPLTTKQHRQPANPGNKTDDTDLAAMQRGAVNGFGL